MERELIELFESVKKAADVAAADGSADSSLEEERCLDALKRLKKFPVNYQVLVSTQVGKRLRHLTKHPRKTIQALASDVVDMWKDIIIKETLKNKSNGSSDDKVSVKAEPADVDAAEAKKVEKVKVEKVSKIETLKLEKCGSSGMIKSERVIKKSETFVAETKSENVGAVKIEDSTSGELVKVQKTSREERQQSDVKKPRLVANGPPKLTSVIYTKDSLRDKTRDMLAEALCKVSSEVDENDRDEVDSCDPYRIAVSVESAMFEKWGRSNGAHKFKYRSILFNIKDPNNPDFRRKVLLGEFKPEDILTLTPQEMASKERQNENKKIEEKALFDCERGGAPKATTSEFKCGRCGQKKCTYYQMQTRSADEPMTTYVTCVNCNNHWKFC